MKRSTLALVIVSVVSLALSVVMGIIAAFVLLDEARVAAKDIDFKAEITKIRDWFSEDDTNDNTKVSITSNGVHVETDDGKTVDVGYDGIKVD